MAISTKILALVASLAPLPAAADEVVSLALKTVVQAAYLATLVPDLCPAYATDMTRFVDMMTTLHLQPADMGVTGRFAPIGMATQVKFRALADRDRAGACDQAWKLLGSEGSVHLLVRRPN